MCWLEERASRQARRDRGVLSSSPLGHIAAGRGTSVALRIAAVGGQELVFEGEVVGHLIQRLGFVPAIGVLGAALGVILGPEAEVFLGLLDAGDAAVLPGELKEVAPL